MTVIEGKLSGELAPEIELAEISLAFEQNFGISGRSASGYNALRKLY
jgi:hypothetical protein